MLLLAIFLAGVFFSFLEVIFSGHIHPQPEASESFHQMSKILRIFDEFVGFCEKFKSNLVHAVVLPELAFL